MKQAREVLTCSRCRQSKRRCDKAKPSCTRCERGGQQCVYDEDQNTERDELSTTSRDVSSTPYSTPATTPPTPARKVRKRNQACLSCIRCHRLKVKCDQREPCARCLRSGVQIDCTYTHPPRRISQAHGPHEQQQKQEISLALPADDPEFVVATWFLRKRASTHFKAILNRVCPASRLRREHQILSRQTTPS
jgi:hypothetical protein